MPRTLRGRAATALAFLLITLLSAEVFAQGEDLAEAQRLFQAGARAYDAGQFAAAAQAFDQAYELSPRAPLRFASAQALRRLYTTERDPELLRRAKGHYKQYISEVKKGRRVKDAIEALGDIELLLATHEPAPKADGEGAEDEDTSPPSAPPAPPTGTLQIDSAIEGATAVVAGLPGMYADLPVWLEIPPGNYEVTIRAEGYVDGKRNARVAEGRLSLADPPLKEKPGRLTITGDEGADVLVDGRPVGHTPVSLDLPSGTHQVVVGKTGHKVLTRYVTTKRASAETLKTDLGMTTQRVAGWTVIAASATSITVGHVLSAIATTKDDDAQVVYERTQGGGGRALTVAERDDYNQQITERNDVLGVAGGAITLGCIGALVGVFMVTLDAADLYGAAAAGKAGALADDAPGDVKPRADSVDLEATLVPAAWGRGAGATLLIGGRF